MISVWPRFTPKAAATTTCFSGTAGSSTSPTARPPTDLPYDKAGSDIDTTNPDCSGKWYWSIRCEENYVAKGFDAFWADETEPDIPPAGLLLSRSVRARSTYNVYPLFHTAAFYNGMRADMQQRALILARDSYLGAQHNGAIFWSSDISPNWDTLKRTGADRPQLSSPAGMPYWSTDIGGWQALPYVPHSPSASAAARPQRRTRQRRAATTTTPSSTPAGSSTGPSSPTSARTARAATTRSGATASRRSPSSRNTYGCATS